MPSIQPPKEEQPIKARDKYPGLYRQWNLQYSGLHSLSIFSTGALIVLGIMTFIFEFKNPVLELTLAWGAFGWMVLMYFTLHKLLREYTDLIRAEQTDLIREQQEDEEGGRPGMFHLFPTMK